MKKLLSIVCVCALVLSSLALTAFAKPVAGCADTGDVDADGKVTAADAREILRLSVSLPTKIDKDNENRADVDHNGKVEASDARHALRASVSLEVIYHHLVESKWTSKDDECDICHQKVKNTTKLEDMMADANAWAEANGFGALIKGRANGENLELVIDVDGIWSFDGYADGAFDGFLTKIGEYVKENIGEDLLTFEVDGEAKEVFKDGALQNHALKEVLFSVGDGFFVKIAHPKENGVYDTYNLTIGGEKVNFTVKLTGSETNLTKVKDFAGVIADHIYAIPGDDLTVGVIAPDALKNVIGNDPAKLNDVTIGRGFEILAEQEIENVFGSQVSAVNKVMALFCEINGFVNKVAGKVTVATVELADGDKVDLFKEGAVFAPDMELAKTNAYKAFVEGVAAMFSDELKATKVGDFAYADGRYTVPVYVEVNMANADIMAGDVISETVNVEINVFKSDSE